MNKFAKLASAVGLTLAVSIFTNCCGGSKKDEAPTVTTTTYYSREVD